MEMEFSSMVEGEGDYIGLEEGRVWLPSHVLDEAFELKESLQTNNHRHHYRRHKTSCSEPNPLVPYLKHQNCFSKTHSTILYQQQQQQRQRLRYYGSPISSVGQGMQAIFLDSNKKQCGTGFFLPRKTGNNLQPTKKPACTVLVPSRVVHALNLNVHELGSPLTPRRRRDSNIDNNTENQVFVKDRDGSDFISENVTTTRCIASSEERNSSPDIFLPKEWSY